MRRERGFTLIEVLIALVVVTVVMTTVVLLARQFLYQVLWSGETFAGIHEAALLESTLRRDLLRADKAAGGLAVNVGAGTLDITLPGGAHVAYRHDATARSLVRTADGAPTPLAVGLVRAFAASPRFVVARGASEVVVPSLTPGDRVLRAGLLIELTVKGQPVAGNEQAAQGIQLSTHVFPHFANLALASLWRPAGGKK